MCKNQSHFTQIINVQTSHKIKMQYDRQLNDSSCYFSDEEEEQQNEHYRQINKKQGLSNHILIQNEPENQQSLKARQEKRALLSAEQNSVNQLKGVQIFQIFYEQSNYFKLIKKCQDIPIALKKFNWRLNYIIGQLIFHIEQYLVKQQLLEKSLKLQVQDVQSISNRITLKAMTEGSNQDQDFILMKKNMQLVYRLDACDIEIARDLYNYCIRILKAPLNFEMKINKKNYQKQQQAYKKNKTKKPIQIELNKQPQPIQHQNQMIQEKPHSKYHPTPKIGPYSVLRMPSNKTSLNNNTNKNNKVTPQTNQKSNQLKIPKQSQTSNDFQVIVSKKSTNSNRVGFPLQNPNFRASLPNAQITPQGKLRGNGLDIEEDNLINLNAYTLTSSQQRQLDQQKKNNANNVNDQTSKTRANNNYPRKWQASEQSTFCKLYSETASPLSCLKAMQQKLGPDSRWRDEYSIEGKIKYLVQKVFNKFMTFKIPNQNINTFKNNKLIVLSCTNMELRHRIFRHIAVIYDAMISVSDNKKQVISRRIIEVNRLCKEIQT